MPTAKTIINAERKVDSHTHLVCSFFILAKGLYATPSTFPFLIHCRMAPGGLYGLKRVGGRGQWFRLVIYRPWMMKAKIRIHTLTFHEWLRSWLGSAVWFLAACRDGKQLWKRFFVRNDMNKSRRDQICMLTLFLYIDPMSTNLERKGLLECGTPRIVLDCVSREVHWR